MTKPKKGERRVKAWAVLYDWGEIAILPSSFTDQYNSKKTGWLALTKRKSNLPGKREGGLLGSIVPVTISYVLPLPYQE